MKKVFEKHNRDLYKPVNDIAEVCKVDFTTQLTEHPTSPLTSLGAQKVNVASDSALKYIARNADRKNKDTTDENIIADNLHNYQAAGLTLVNLLIPRLIRGETPAQVMDYLQKSYGEEDPERVQILRDVLPPMFSDMKLHAPLASGGMKYNFAYDIKRFPDSAYKESDITRINDAFAAVLRHVDKSLENVLATETEPGKLAVQEHEHSAIAANYRDYLIYELIKGETPFEKLATDMAEQYKESKPIKYRLLLETLPIFCEKMGLEVPASLRQASPKPKRETIVEIYNRDVSKELSKNPKSPMQQLGAGRINAAFTHALEGTELDYQKSLEGVTNGDKKMMLIHEHRSAAMTMGFMLGDLIEGKSVEQVVNTFADAYEIKSPEKCEAVKKSFSGFLSELDLQVPQRLLRPPMANVLIIDDSLAMDLKERRIDCTPKQIFANPNRAVQTWHAKTPEEAERVFKYYQYNGQTPDAVICDYKLHRPGELEVWGDKLLGDLLTKYDMHPKKVFLISKSGFKDEDKAQLAERGITYAHSNELHALAASKAKDERNLDFCTSIATTSLLREWANANLSTDCPTGRYESPHINEIERASLTPAEVVRRVKSKEATQLEAYPLLDMKSIAHAFRARVDDAGLAASDKASLPPGIKGPSFQGRLALSKEGIGIVRADKPGAPVLLVLNEDYSAADNAYIKDVSGLVLLKRGTQHVAIMARNKNIPVAFARGTDSAVLSVKGNTLYIQDRGLKPVAFAKQGDLVTFDGEQLMLCKGKVPLIQPPPEEKQAVRELAAIAANHIGNNWHVMGQPDRTGVKVRINLDSAEDLKHALDLNIPFNGVGLFRTERDVLENSAALQGLQDAVLGDGEHKTRGIEQICKHSEDSFAKLFAYAKEQHATAPGAPFPITVRLLDAPAAEAYPAPDDAKAVAACATRLGTDEAEVSRRLTEVREQAHLRGAGFALAHPEIYEAQCEALFTAAKTADATPDILIPNIRTPEELRQIKTIVERAAERHDMQDHYRFGAMLETRDSVLESPQDEIAKKRIAGIVKQCDFVSFGTNDLTEELLNLRRGDFEAVAAWQHAKQNPFDPFTTLDDTVKNAIHNTEQYIHTLKPLMAVSVCGQHAASPVDAGFFQEHNIASVSVPPTEEAICSGLIQAGGAALHSSVAERERLNALRSAGRAKAWSAPAKASLTGVQVPSPNTLQNSRIAFLYIEDDGPEAARLAEDFKGKPVVIASSVAEGLRSVESLKKQGKKVVLVTDMQLPFGDEVHRQGLMEQYPWMKSSGPESKWGVMLANAAQEGQVPGIEPGDVHLMTAGDPKYYNLNSGVPVLRKVSNFEEACTAMMDGYMQNRQEQIQRSDGGAPPL